MACSGGPEEWHEWWGLRWQHHTELSKQAVESDLGARVGFAPDLEQFLHLSESVSLSGPWRVTDAGIVPGPCVHGVGGEGTGSRARRLCVFCSSLSSAAYPAGRSLSREKEKKPF